MKHHFPKIRKPGVLRTVVKFAMERGVAARQFVHSLHRAYAVAVPRRSTEHTPTHRQRMRMYGPCRQKVKEFRAPK